MNKISLAGELAGNAYPGRGIVIEIGRAHV